MRYYNQNKDDIPNFAEVALLISHATQIYGRKVDWIYNFINQINASTSKSVELCETTKQKAAADAAAAAAEQPDKKKKERKAKVK